MLYGVGGSAIDGGLLAEGLFDLQGRRALPPFKRDICVGTRLAWNDSADTALIFLGSTTSIRKECSGDLDSSAAWGKAKSSRSRFGNSLTSIRWIVSYR